MIKHFQAFDFFFGDVVRVKMEKSRGFRFSESFYF